MHTHKKSLIIVCLVFFLSGCSALVFETVWFRVASLVLGSSIWSAAAVLMAFMSGLAIGNALMATRGHLIRDGFRFYIGIELIIGITGMLTVWLLPNLSLYLIQHIAILQGDVKISGAIRFAIAFTVLLVPAVAMGATLPLLQNLIYKRDSSFSDSMGKLYGWNTLGAVSGVLVAEFFLIGAIGLKASALTACLLNFIAALLIQKSFGDDVTHIEKQEPLFHSKIDSRVWKILAAPFMTGLLLLALEVIWFRYLLMAHGGTSITFSIMLATILCGIGLGGILISRIRPGKTTLNKLLLFLPILASFITLISFYAYSVAANHYLLKFITSEINFAAAACLLMFPVSLISGMIFPLYGEFFYLDNKKITFSAGALTLANTIGAALGSGIASFILLPQLGIENSILLIASLYLLTALLWYKNHNDGKLPSKILIYAAIPIIFIFMSASIKGVVEKNYGKFCNTMFRGWNLIKMVEGLNETIGYMDLKVMGKPIAYRLITNAHSMSGTTTPSLRYMKFYVYFPYVIQQNVRSVLQISYGVGNTAEAVTALDTMEHFDLVDLSPDILENSHIVHDATGKYPLLDPRTRVHIEDGRFFLQTTPHHYDLITAEPPPPKHAGVVNLYSKEYFQLAMDKLTPDGVVTYWLPVHSLHASDTLAIIRAFCDVFPDCSLWDGAGLDLMLVGTKSGLHPINEEHLQKRWDTKIGNELRSIGFESPALFLATFMADPETLKALTADTKPVTDNFPQRISPTPKRGASYNDLYAFLFDIKRREKALENSEYLNSLFSKESLLDARNVLWQEGLLTSLWAPAYANATTDKNRILDNIFDIALEKNGEYILATTLNISPAEFFIIENADEVTRNSDEFKLEYMKYLLIQKKYYDCEVAALEFTMKQLQNKKSHRESYEIYLFAMALGGKASHAKLDFLPEEDAFMRWYKTRFLSGNTKSQ